MNKLKIVSRAADPQQLTVAIDADRRTQIVVRIEDQRVIIRRVVRVTSAILAERIIDFDEVREWSP